MQGDIEDEGAVCVYILGLQMEIILLATMSSARACSNYLSRNSSVVVFLGERGLVLIDEITAKRPFPQPKTPAKTTLDLKNSVLIASGSKSVDPQVQDNTP
jgi:hypothetical protein